MKQNEKNKNLNIEPHSGENMHVDDTLDYKACICTSTAKVWLPFHKEKKLEINTQKKARKSSTM